MRNGAVTFALVLAVAYGVAFVGCGSDPDVPTPQDGGSDAPDTSMSDTTTVDTARVDTGLPETAPVCPAALPSDFACVAPYLPIAQKVCTDKMLRALLSCFGGGDDLKCIAAKKAYPACSSCVINDWLERGEVASASCIQTIDPAGSCGKTLQCAGDCAAKMCEGCAPPSRDACHQSVSAGPSADAGDAGDAGAGSTCYQLAAKDVPACEADPKLRICFVRDAEDLVRFFRGACRDKGDWSKADLPDGTESDAGTDAAADSASDSAADVADDSSVDGG
jgi:hypothetical protein